MTAGSSGESSDSSDELSLSNLLSASDASTGGSIPPGRVHRALTEVVRENPEHSEPAGAHQPGDCAPSLRLHE